MNASEAIRESRRLAGLTQVELAARLGHASNATISDWERGRGTPSAASVFGVLAACGVDGYLDADGWSVGAAGR